MIDAKTLRFITLNGLQNFAKGRILDGISALRTLLPYCAEAAIIRAEAESLEENYHRMLSFLREGGNDEKRGEMQAKLRRKGVTLLEKAERAIRIKLDSDLYCRARKEVSLETDILENDERQDDIFDMLWTSPIWTAQDTALWYDFILRQRDMVQQHLTGALFLSIWEHYDAEKMQLLNLLSESECRRTHLAAIAYLLLLRIRHKELIPLMPPLPPSLLSRKGKAQIAKVQYEMLLMLISEKDMEKELKEAEGLTNDIISGKQTMSVGNLKKVVELRGRYLKNRLQRGLDINLSKVALIHNCEYMRRVSHWFIPFDKTHPLFQSVMIDEKGNEKQNLSTLVDLIMDCDIDKLTMLYLVSNDKDFSKAVKKLDAQELPELEHAVIPEYTFRFIMQDLYRFFFHSPLYSQLINPFRTDETLLDFPEYAALFSAEETVDCCELLYELGRDKQVLSIISKLIEREGASASALLLKGKALRRQKRYSEAINCARNAELLEPENTAILQFLVECFSYQSRGEEVLEYLQKLAELKPDDMRIRRLIPVTLNKLGRKEEALTLLFKLDYESTEEDEDYETIVSSIADIALSLGKLDIAERYTEKALQLSDCKVSDCQIRMGHIKLLQGDWKEALKHYEQFINTYCKQHESEAKVALSEFNKSREMLVSKGIKEEDFLLIYDTLLASAEGSL